MKILGYKPAVVEIFNKVLSFLHVQTDKLHYEVCLSIEIQLALDLVYSAK